MESTTPVPSGTVTFLFTDIEGSTRLWEQHLQAMRLALARHDAILRAAIETNDGYVFKTIGDQFCAAFATAPKALAAALTAQRALGSAPGGEVGPLRVRMALHTGAAEERDGDYFGPPLNRIARLLSAGHGGQIIVSQTTADLLQGALPEETQLRDLGAHRLKDLQQPEHLFQLVHPGLPAQFPPLRSLEAFAHNLPAQLTSFIGREKEIAEVKQLLATTRLLTLTGSGGCGKTRLALQVAANLLEEFSDGVWLVELAPFADPALVPQTVASTVGVREEPNRPLTATLTDYLRAKSLLLILDNCEHLLAACAQLVDALLRACPKLRILASSREALGIRGEQTYRVPSLSLPKMPDARRQAPDASQTAGDPIARNPSDWRLASDVRRLMHSEAVQLFADRARLSQASFAVTQANAPAVAQVCQRLDGIPLAIELAAARVKVLSAEQINARLDDRFRLLTGGSRTALPRQQTLRALIDWSYDLLSEPERVLLRLLSVFAGGWTLEAAEGVCVGDGLEAWEVLDLLTGLADKSLVIVDEAGEQARYRLLETVRQYARDRLLEAGEAEGVRERHRDWFLALAEEAGQGLWGESEPAWLDRLEREHDNLRAALAWCQTVARPASDARALDTPGSDRPGSGRPTHDVDAGLRLSGALWKFWEVRGYVGEGREHLARLLALPGAEARTAVRALALLGAGWLTSIQGDSTAARGLVEESLALYRELDNKEGIAYSATYLGLIAGDSGASRALWEESLGISRKLGDKKGIAWSLFALGYLAQRQGDYGTAQPPLEESLEIFRELGNTLGIAWSLASLGWAAHARGDYGGARTRWEESLAINRELGDKQCIVMDLEGLASVAVAQAQPERATRLFGTAERLREAIGAPLPLADQAEHDRSVAAVRTALGDGTFAAAWAEGRAMSLEAAINSALEE